MIILDGKNLGERQQHLNKLVNDAVEDTVDFNVVKEQEEKSDVDKLFKIDLAAQYRNIKYILEILKGGDHLYISRALDKCNWLYIDEMKHIINDDYLSKNVFPFMSIKMRNKMLTAIATVMDSNDTRAVEFSAYCMKIKLYNIALKFLIHTSTSYKLELILMKTKAYQLITQKEGDYLEFYIGDSFDLAENYVRSLDSRGHRGRAVYFLKYMYSLSNEKYLDMLETCDECYVVHVLGRRLSKHIIKNHKSRVMKKPLLYANALNKDIIKRNCKIEEAKIFAVALLPDRSTRFFYSYYYGRNKFVLDLIPIEEKFTFIKKIYTEKYKDETFETRKEFYSNGFYEIMTIHERELWALQNIASQNELLGVGNDYIWYKFVSFDKAFEQLRKEIMKTTNVTKRSEILKVLLDSAKNEKELTKLLNYFYDRHRNEVAYVTECFLGKLIEDHKVWRFGEICWNALEQIFYNIEVFDESKDQYCYDAFRVLVLMYYVLNEKSIPDTLNECLQKNLIQFYTLKKYMKNDKYETETLYQYILQYYMKNIEKLTSTPYEGDMNKKNKYYLGRILEIAYLCEKTKDDLPEIVLRRIKLDWPDFKHHKLLADKMFSSIDIRNYLKKDATLVVTQFPLIKSYCESRRGNLNWLVHKLKVYFSHDVSEKYLTLFNEYLSAESLHYFTVVVAVRGIFTLGDKTRKYQLLEKYAPIDKAIDKAKMCKNTLDIQKAICSQMLCSRPPLPLINIFQYVIGDYVQYCLVLFRSFLVNLPQPQSLEFVQRMINSPISVQKHGLRLAFECVEAEKLQMIILESWNKTKNVSLRMVLYKQLSMKIADESFDMQSKLFDTLITLTLDLNEYDDEALKLIDSIRLPDHLVGRYLEAAWNTVSKFTGKPQNFERMGKIIHRIENKLYLVPEQCVDKIINDHVHVMLDEGMILSNKNNQGSIQALLISKWNLTMSSVAYMTNDKKLEKNLQLGKHIVKKCIEMWNELDESGKYIVRQFLNNFITDLDVKSYDYDEKSYSNYVNLIQEIEQNIMKALPETDIYLLLWNLRTNIVTKMVIMQLNLCMETLNHENIRESFVKLGKHIGMMVKINADNGKFYLTFCEKLQNTFTTAVEKFRNYFKRWDLFSMTDAIVIFCLGLLEEEIFEAYLLALNMLPSDYEGTFLDAYLSAIQKIQNYENAENTAIKFSVYEKFVNTDFKKRNYIK